MQVQYSPQISGQTVDYTFYDNDKLKAVIDGKEQVFDLSTVEVGKAYQPIFPIMDAFRTEQGLILSLFKPITLEADESESFPKAFEPTTDGELAEKGIQLELLGPPPKTQLSELDRLRAENAMLKKRIDTHDAVMFELTGAIYGK